MISRTPHGWPHPVGFNTYIVIALQGHPLFLHFVFHCICYVTFYLHPLYVPSSCLACFNPSWPYIHIALHPLPGESDDEILGLHVWKLFSCWSVLQQTWKLKPHQRWLKPRIPPLKMDPQFALRQFSIQKYSNYWYVCGLWLNLYPLVNRTHHHNPESPSLTTDNASWSSFLRQGSQVRFRSGYTRIRMSKCKPVTVINIVSLWKSACGHSSNSLGCALVLFWLQSS